MVDLQGENYIHFKVTSLSSLVLSRKVSDFQIALNSCNSTKLLRFSENRGMGFCLYSNNIHEDYLAWFCVPAFPQYYNPAKSS